MSPASRKDFVLIAEVIRACPMVTDRETLALAMAEALYGAYPNFDPDRFFEAATGLDYATRLPLAFRKPISRK